MTNRQRLDVEFPIDESVSLGFNMPMRIEITLKTGTTIQVVLALNERIDIRNQGDIERLDATVRQDTNEKPKLSLVRNDAEPS